MHPLDDRVRRVFEQALAGYHTHNPRGTHQITHTIIPHYPTPAYLHIPTLNGNVLRHTLSNLYTPQPVSVRFRVRPSSVGAITLVGSLCEDDTLPLTIIPGTLVHWLPACLFLSNIHGQHMTPYIPYSHVRCL